MTILTMRKSYTQNYPAIPIASNTITIKPYNKH